MKARKYRHASRFALPVMQPLVYCVRCWGVRNIGMERIMSSDNKNPAFILIILISLFASAAPAGAADLSCVQLVPSGVKLICPGFEPNWAIELECNQGELTANYIDAFSGDDIVTLAGEVTILSQDPWGFSTSHGVEGLISRTPGACQDESDRIFDLTLTTDAIPDYSGQIAPICCRLE